MNLYLDTNVIVGFLTADVLSDRAEAFLQANTGPFVVSDLVEVEFASVVARQVRARERSPDEAVAIFAEFDAWRADVTVNAGTSSEHLALASRYLRRLDLSLLAPDAIHIAIAQRTAATLVTFDRQMAAAARTLGVAVVEP